MRAIKNVTIVIILGLALLAQLINPSAAYADGESTPPPAGPSAETPAPGPTDPPRGVAPTELPSDIPMATSTPMPSVSDTLPEAHSGYVESAPSSPVSTEAATSTDAALTGQPTLINAVQTLSGETNVVVLDSKGEFVPLASQAAADAIANSDPVWCPAGQAPTPGANGCSGSYTSLASLLADLGALNFGTGINASGTIWIESSYISFFHDPASTGFTLDGVALTTWANNALTLQGGWSGISGDMSPGSSSVFTVPITIANWNNSVTINNIIAANGLAIVNDPWGSSPNQIGDVTIDHVTASHLNVTTNSSGNTIHISNSSSSNGSGAYVDGWLNSITIDNSHFDNNAGSGLVVFNGWGSLGLTITSSTFDGNAGDGASLAYVYAPNIASSSFSGNAGSGATIAYANNVNIGGSTFSGNASAGVSTSFVDDVAINSSTLSGNTGTGVTIADAFNVNIGSSTFSGNVGGIYVNSIYNAATVTIDHVTVDGSSGFGLGVETNGGNTTISNSTFSNTVPDYSVIFPWGDGVDLFPNGGDVTITNSQFTGNALDGLYAVAAGTIDVQDSTFSGNTGSGATLADASNVNVGNSTFSGNVGGIYVNAINNVTVDHVTVDGSSGFGLAVETNGGNITIGNSSFSNTVPDGNAIFPWGDGVDLFPNGGDVTITNSQFINSAFDGLYVSGADNIDIQDGTFANNLIGGLDVWGVNNINFLSQPPSSQFGANFYNNLEYDLFVLCNPTGTYIGLNFPDPTPLTGLVVNDQNLNGQNPLNVCSLYSLFGGRVPSGSPAKHPAKKKAQIHVGSSNVTSESHIELFLCADGQAGHRINLPNGDKVEIVCPVSGKASISRLDNTTLPGELPAGYIFASAFQVDIAQLVKPIQVIGGEYKRESIEVITEGGYIKASFVASSLQPGSTYAILYWDRENETWIPLKDYMRGENGLPQAFSLHSDNPDDPKQIISGVEFLSKAALPRVEVSVNFTGQFVLVQH